MNTPQNDGGQAFPMHERDDALRGMSLRDWFAGQALAGYMAYSHPQSIVGIFPESAAKVAYECADAMLAARNERQKP